MSRLFWHLMVLAAFILFLFDACIVVDAPFSGLPPGPWRAVLKLDSRPATPNPEGKPLPEKMNMEFEEVTDGELPFQFMIHYESENEFYIELINGAEHIRLDDITIGIDRSTAKDTVVIRFPPYDAYLYAIYEEDILEGEWAVDGPEGYRIPFVARQGQGHRFTTLRKEPLMDISGRWEVTFGIDGEDAYPAVGEFQQEGNHLTGTFLTESGDKGFLEGTVQDDKFYLSGFNGARAFLVEGKIRPDSTLLGYFRSGRQERTLWSAARNPDFQLRSPHELTTLREGSRFDFSIENAKGQLISPDSPPYQDKVRIVQIMGSWNPNSLDEARFLKQFLEEHPRQDIAVIGLAFEKQESPEKAKIAIEAFKEEAGINYEILLAGKADEQEVRNVLPMLSGKIAFPSLIILSPEGEVVRIHTGFSGPATEEYAIFKEEFETFIRQLHKTQIQQQ